MRKIKYNQGDLMQFQRTFDGGDFRFGQLFVITEVYTKGGPRGDTPYYNTTWLMKGDNETFKCFRKEVYDIGILDDDSRVKLIAPA
jgi:hypothetical protein